MVMRQVPQDVYYGLGVYFEYTLCEDDSLIPPVTLCFSFVGSKLHSRDEARIHKLLEPEPQCGYHREEPVRLAMPADPYVRVRISVADEEPTVAGAAGDQGGG